MTINALLYLDAELTVDDLAVLAAWLSSWRPTARDGGPVVCRTRPLATGAGSTPGRRSSKQGASAGCSN